MNAFHFNRQSSRPRRGFNLLELLIVITIIGILASIMAPALTAVGRHVKNTRAKSTALDLTNAINTYFTEYRKLPYQASESDDAEISLNSDQTLMNVLCASPSEMEENGLSPRGIVFFTGGNAKPLGEGRFHSGLKIAEDGSVELFDPWGEYYRVILDGDSNGRIKKPSWDKTNSSYEIANSILVWSPGPDGEDEEAKDNVKTW